MESIRKNFRLGYMTNKMYIICNFHFLHKLMLLHYLMLGSIVQLRYYFD